MESSTTGRQLARGAGLIVGHVAAVVFGAILILVGSAMGVSLVLLPAGIPLGLIGLACVIWGLFQWASNEDVAGKAPQRQPMSDEG
jgi:hypothetical protein